MTAQALAPSDVLIIDDDPLLLVVAESYFRAKGSKNIRTAQDGLVALKVLDELEVQPGLILCDLNMPNIDGLQFLRLLKQQDYDGPVAILSSEHQSIISMAEKLAKTHDLNIVAALSKPLKPIELDNILLTLKKPVLASMPTARQQISKKELQCAIASGNIIPWYQPKVDAQTGRIVGVEALARWVLPDGDIIEPDNFIPLAEQTGLIKLLTQKIIRQVIKDAKRLTRLRLNLGIAINLSVNVLDDVEFPDQIAFLIDESNLASSMFTFEITESGIIEKGAVPIEVLARLRMLRFGLSIDDFGTAHSNLEHLIQFPFTELKIDRMFVSNARADEKAMASVETSITLARKLGLSIVAEGVEAQEDWKYLDKLGVDELQGFLFSKALPFDE
ncbi:MAG: EAL domain-containing protein, partial [Hyphomicrobiaceae bacterium]|nr:EAL domain-containing protein [Hyphomicrobiaceae bacterium]